MELREIEIFLTQARELHFGQTPERLVLSQVRVNQSIKSQGCRSSGHPVSRALGRAPDIDPQVAEFAASFRQRSRD
ncbi:hypothetical protein [Nocardia tengchongensis]|uniref:hypothetical protein n=1 Tax=Nocardia tengchongensis TaxID=2055889 RepID=UPI003698AE63